MGLQLSYQGLLKFLLLLVGALTGAVTGAATGSHVVTSYLTLGTGDQYLFFGEAQTEASVVAEATTLVGTSKKGSLYLSAGTNAQLWLFDGDTTATSVFYG